MKKSIAVLGLGSFGKELAIQLSQNGADVLAIDISEAAVNQVAEYVKIPVVADVNDKATLSKLGLDSIDAAVVCMAENLEASIYALMSLKENGVKKIWMKAVKEEHKKIFMELGATKVFMPEIESASNMAKSFVVDNFDNLIALSDRIEIIKVKPKAAWVGKSLLELNLRKTYKINIVAIEVAGDITLDIDPNQPLEKDCFLWLATDKKHVSKLKAK